MATDRSHDPIQPLLDQLKRRDEERRGVRKRKMVDLDIAETSAVARPAHLVEGWLVMKSADDGHRHRTDSDYLGGPALASVQYYLNTDTIPAGSERPINPADKSRTVGRSSCGCVYMRTPETIARAVSDAYVNEVAKAAPRKKHIWDPAEIAYLEAEIKQLGGRRERF